MNNIFKDFTIQNKLNEDGFIVVDLFAENEIKEIKIKSLSLVNAYKNILPNRYFPVGQLDDYKFRNDSTKLIEQLVVPKIYTLFNENSITIHSGTHLVKPRGLNSFLATHQDSSIVDEEKHNAILFWTPLQKINFLNGELFVLKGSHKFENKYRSTTIPWKFKNVQNLIYKYSIPIKIKLGQVCFFHSALIHHSGYNFTTKYRMAVSSFITDKDANLLNYYMDKNAAGNTIEVYEVDERYYHNNNFNERPTNQKLKEEIDNNKFSMEQKEFMKLLKKHTLI